MNLTGYLAIALAIVLLIAAAGAIALQKAEHRADTLAREVERLSADNTRLAADAKDRHELQARLEQLDTQHTAVIEAAHREAETLRAAVRDGARRLSIRATCPARVPEATRAAGVDHEPSRADIDPGAAARIVGLTDRGDAAIRQLTACQQYIRTVRGAG